MSVLNFSVDNHIAHLEMNRPEVMNALNFELNQGLADAWREVEENDDIWVAILSAHPGQPCLLGGDGPQGARGDERGRHRLAQAAGQRQQ